MRELELHHLSYMGRVVELVTGYFKDPHNHVYMSNSIGNAHYTAFEDDHYAIEHLLSGGGRVVIDVKYEPDWKDEDSE